MINPNGHRLPYSEWHQISHNIAYMAALEIKTIGRNFVQDAITLSRELGLLKKPKTCTRSSKG